MAEFQSTIELKAVTSQLENKLKKVHQGMNKLNKEVDKTNNAYQKMSTKASGAFSRLNRSIDKHKAKLVGLSVTIAGFAAKGVSDFKKFETGMAQIGTLGVKDLKKVTRELNNVRKGFGVTGAEATKGYYDVISAGAKEGTEALSQFTAATRLAKAGNTDLNGAIDIVTSGMNIFAENGETAFTISDKLFKAVKFGKTTVEELGNTFGLVAPVVKAAGLGMDDYAAAMATITAGGIRTSVATTGFKAVLSNLIKVTPKAAKEAKKLGLDFSLVALRAKGLGGFLQDVKDKTGGNIVSMGKLFDSIEAINTASVMTSDGGIANMTRNLESMKNSAGATDEALKTVQKTAKYKFDKFSQSLSILSETIGSAVVPGLLDMVTAIQPVIDAFAHLISLNPGIVSFTMKVGLLAGSLALLGGPVTVAIAAVGGALLLVMKHFKAFEHGAVFAVNLISLKWNNFLAGFRINGFEKAFKGLGKSFSEGVSGIWDDFVKDEYFDFGDMFDQALPSVKKTIEGIRKEVAKLTDWFVTPVWEAAKAVERAFFWVWDQVMGNSWIPDMVSGIKNEIDKLWSWFVAPVEKMTNQVSGFFKKLQNEDLTPSEQVSTYWSGLTDTITKGWKEATGYVSDVAGNIKDIAKDASDVDKLDFQGFVNLLASKGLIENLNVVTQEFRKAMEFLGIAVERPLTGLSAISKISFGTQVRELQKLVQSSREFSAAISDDFEGKSQSTDTKTHNRAMENATKLEKALRKERILKIKSMGPELAKIAQAEVDAQMKRLAGTLQEKHDFKRGLISRYLFGEGTSLTLSEKVKGLMGNFGKMFDWLGGKIVKMSTGLDQVISKLKDVKLREAKTSVTLNKMAVESNKNILDKAKDPKDPSVSQKRPTEKLRGIQKSLDKSLERLRVSVEKRDKAIKSTVKRAEKIAKIELKIAGLMESWEKASANTASAVERNQSTAKLIAEENKALNAVVKAEAKLAAAKTGVITAVFVKLGKLLGALGHGMTIIVEQSSKVTSMVSNLATRMVNSKAAELLKSTIKTIGQVSGLTKILSVVSSFARKVLIPIFAIIDGFRGFTDLTTLQTNIDSSRVEFTVFEKSISGFSEALGSFFNGIVHIFGTVLKYLGAEHLAKWMSDINLAPQFAKVFKIVHKIIKVLANVFGAIFGSGGDGESSITKLIKKVGALLSAVLDFLLEMADGLLLISEGEFSKGLSKLVGAFANMFTTIVKAVADAVVFAANGIAGKISDIFDHILEGIRSIIPTWMGGTSEQEKPVINVEAIKAGQVKEAQRTYDNAKVARDVAQQHYLALVDAQKLSEKHAAGTGMAFTQSLREASAALSLAVKALDTARGDNASLKGYATGGPVSGTGTGTSDSIAAMLSNGEFVVKADAASKHRGLLDKINAGGKIQKFSEGTPAAASSKDNRDFFQFIQIDDKGKFDYTKTINEFTKGLDMTTEKGHRLWAMFDALEKNTDNLSGEEILKQAMTKDANTLLLEMINDQRTMNYINKDLAKSSKDASGAIAEIPAAIENAFKGMAKKATQPFKQALTESGDLMEALKEGAYGLYKDINMKLLDAAFKPAEQAIDSVINELFGGTLAELGSSPVNPLYTTDASTAVTAVTDATGADGGMLSGLISSMGAMLSGVWSSITGVFSGLFATQTATETASDSIQTATKLSAGAIQTGSIIAAITSIGGTQIGIMSAGFPSIVAAVAASAGANVVGGLFSKGGVVPKAQYLAGGGFAGGPKGSDTVPAWLTPGEMVLNRDQQTALGGSMGNTVNQTINISGNVDDRAIQQIQAITRNVISSDSGLVANSASVGQRRGAGLNKGINSRR